MKNIGITGTGFIGSHITKLLMEKGYNVTIFTRHPTKYTNTPRLTYTMLDYIKEACDFNALKELDAVINLAGAGIADKRWSAKRKEEIRNSRTMGTRFLVSQLKTYAPRCKVFISASAIGFYGTDIPGHTPFTEDAPSVKGFLSEVCTQWERESLEISTAMRTVIFRFGIVLGKESGAFPQFAKPVSLGVLPILGSGRQIMSWVHISDLAALLFFALKNDNLSGIYNAVAPNPVSQKQLVKAIAKSRMRLPLPAPAPLLKILLGEMSTEILNSCTVSANKITEAGFIFQYPLIDEAVKAILHDK